VESKEINSGKAMEQGIFKTGVFFPDKWEKHEPKEAIMK
jgi:hypothetical protein